MSVPEVSSGQLTTAFRRLGFKGKKSSGSHQTWVHAGPPKRAATLILGKSSIPKPTLAGILRTAQVSEEEFCVALGGQYKKAEKQRQKAAKKKVKADAKAEKAGATEVAPQVLPATEPET